MASSQIRPYILEAKSRLQLGFESLRTQHRAGLGGLETCRGMTRLWDEVLCSNYRAAVDDLFPDEKKRDAYFGSTALVALGGFGRQDVAPFSDVDLMLLYIPGVVPEIEKVAGRLVQDGFDVGLKLSLATRTLRDACTQAFTDPTILTSFTETRLLLGSQSLVEKFHDRFLRLVRRKAHWSMDFVEKSRKKEQDHFGETVYLLSPNIKCSRGGLREIHLVRWLGFVRYGETSLHRLREIKALSKVDFRQLVEAREFLLRLRNELHFHAGRVLDTLDRGEQLRIAELWNYPAGLELLPVQELMRDYFRHSTEARYSSFQFVNDVRGKFGKTSIFEPLVGRRQDEHFIVTPRYVAVSAESKDLVKSDLEQVLRLMEISNRSKKWIEQSTWRSIRNAMIKQSHLKLNAAAKNYFMQMLANPFRLANLLRRLHEMNVLEKIIPAFRHARWLLQFNQYHKYTVDEHTLIAVEMIAAFEDDPSPVGRAYRQVQRKDLLHLATLLHDVGKGYTGDHSEVGSELAEQTCDRLGLSDADTETVSFLVRHHLLMSTLAFRRDITAPQVIEKFALEVGSIEMLRMLFTLTCADMAAVSPGSFNEWRRSLVTELFLRTDAFLGDDEQGNEFVERLGSARRNLVELTPEPWKKWMAASVMKIAVRNFRGQDPAQMVQNLLTVAQLPPEKIFVNVRGVSEPQAIEVTIGKHQQRVSGVFYRLIGSFIRNGLEVFSARIELLPSDLVWYSFLLNDRDFVGPVSPARGDQIAGFVEQVLSQPTDELAKPRRTWGDQKKADEAERQQTRVIIDNETAEHATIIDVFAYDHPNLLYTMAKKLYQLELDIRFAKIASHMDQVVDVFYVTDANGLKILDKAKLEFVRSTLLEALNAVDV